MATNTRFRCPYCGKMYSKHDLVTHIGSRHSDELPESFTPLRAVFHIVNRKPFDYNPACRICHDSTPWDEKKGRYGQLCGKQSCHDMYVARMRKNMGDKLGINRQTKTAEGLEKMLANRKISGKYRFRDGGEVTYTGSYEKKALEFFDKILECKSTDIMCPGPVLEYELDGVKHYYITDIYYIPYDLIIEVKDGGDHPNSSPSFAETRRKVIAKEKFVLEKTNFNYLRLTDNDFSQLLNIFADLKMSFNDSRISGKDPVRIIHANESKLYENMVGAIQAAFPAPSKDDVVVVNYCKNNVFGKTNLAVADNIKFDHMFKQNEYTSIVEECDKDFLNSCTYDLYVVNSPFALKKIKESLGQLVDPDFMYTTIFGHPQYTDDQIQFESAAREAKDYYTSLVELSESITKYIYEDTTNLPTLIFDFGGVLVKSRCEEEDLVSVPEKYRAEIRQAMRDYWGSEHNECLSIEDEMAGIAKLVSDDAKPFVSKGYMDIFANCAPYPYTDNMLRTLKEKGYKLYYLSNWTKAGFEACQAKGIFDFMKYFDGGVVSYQVEVRKPEPDIYNELIYKFNLDPRNCIFFDDKQDNVDAAKELGMRAYVFEPDKAQEMVDAVAKDKVPVNESAATDAKINKIAEMQKTLVDFDYGVVVNGNPVHDLSSVKPEDYVTSTATTFEQKKIGTCYDFVNYQHAYFNKIGVTDKTYFAIMGEVGRKVTPTHTFSTFKDKDGKVWWFEAAWGAAKGLRSYKDEKELLEDFVERFTKNRSKWNEVDIYNYTPGSKYVGISYSDFINKITTECKMIKQVMRGGTTT